MILFAILVTVSFVIVSREYMRKMRKMQADISAHNIYGEPRSKW